MTGSAAGATGAPVQEIVDRLGATAQKDQVTLGDVLAAFGRKSFLPMLMVPALLLVSPMSGIPLFSSACGILIVLVSAQMLWPGRDHLWLPGRLTRQKVSGKRARDAVDRLGRLARWLDRRARQRLSPLVSTRTGQVVLEACCLLAGATIPFFEIVPFTSSILGLAVLLMATGLLTRDGLFSLAGLAVLVLAPLVPILIADQLIGNGG